MMKSIAFAALSLCLSAVLADERIVGGSLVEKDTYPWFTMVLFKPKGGYMQRLGCGGSLIHKEWVLTAAHCTYGHEEQWAFARVIVGAYKAPWNTNGGQRSVGRRVAQIYEHPDYDPNTEENDFALLKLHGAIPDTIQPVPFDDMGLSDTYETGKIF